MEIIDSLSMQTAQHIAKAHNQDEGAPQPGGSLANVGYYTLLLLIKMIAHLPFRVLYALSDLIYFPLYYLMRYRRKVVRKNLVESFPEKSFKEIIEIEKKFYHSFVDITLETCKLATISPEEMKQRMHYTDTERVNSLLAQGEKLSVYIGHFGNWEWHSSMSLWLDKQAVPAQIFHKLRSNAMDRLMHTLRERFGHISVDMHQTARFVANSTTDTRPYIIGFIADQSPKKRECKYYMEFLNHQVPVLIGTEKLTKRYGYKAFFLSVKRIRRGWYEGKYLPLSEHPETLPDYELTQLYYQELEKEVRRQPELYLWSHNRFKHATGCLTPSQGNGSERQGEE